MKQTLVIIAVLVLVLVGCAPKEAMPPAPTATDEAVSEVGGAVSDLDMLAEDLDISELDALDQELADLESLELQ